MVNFEPVFVYWAIPSVTYSFKSYVLSFDQSEKNMYMVPVLLFFSRNSVLSTFESNQ